MPDKVNANGNVWGSRCTTSSDNSLPVGKKASATGSSVTKSTEKNRIAFSSNKNSISDKQTIINANIKSDDIYARKDIKSHYNNGMEYDDSDDDDDDFNYRRDLSNADTRYWMAIDGKALVQPLGSENCWEEVGNGRVEIIDGLTIRVVHTSFIKRGRDEVPLAESSAGEVKSVPPHITSSISNSCSVNGDSVIKEGTTGSDGLHLNSCAGEYEVTAPNMNTSWDAAVIVEDDELLYEEVTEVFLEDPLDPDTPLVGENLCIVWNSMEQQLSLCLMFSNEEGYEAVWYAIHAAQALHQQNRQEKNKVDTRLKRNFLLQHTIACEEHRRSLRSMNHVSTNGNLSLPRVSSSFDSISNISKSTAKCPTAPSLGEGATFKDGSSFLDYSSDSAISFVMSDFDPVAVGVPSDIVIPKRRLLRGIAKELRRVFLEHLFVSEDEEEMTTIRDKMTNSTSDKDSSVEDVNYINGLDNIACENTQGDLPISSIDKDIILKHLRLTPIRKRRKPLQVIEKYVICQSIIQYKFLETFPDLFFGLNVDKILANFVTLAKDPLQKHLFMHQVLSHPAIHSFQGLYHPRVAIGLLAIGDISLLEHIISSDIPSLEAQEVWERTTAVSVHKCGTNGSSPSVSKVSSLIINSPFEKLCRTLRIIFGEDSLTVALRGRTDGHITATQEKATEAIPSPIEPFVPLWRVPRGLEVLFNSPKCEEATKIDTGGCQTVHHPASAVYFGRNIISAMRLHYLKNEAFPHGGKPLLLNDYITLQGLDASIGAFQLTEEKSITSSTLMINSGVIICGYMNSDKFSRSSPSSNERVTAASKLLPLPLLPLSSDGEIVTVIDTLGNRLLNDTLCSLLIDEKILQRAVQQLFVLPPKDGSTLATRVPFAELPEFVVKAARSIHKISEKALAPRKNDQSKKKNIIGKISKVNKNVNEAVGCNGGNEKQSKEMENSEIFQMQMLEKLCDLDSSSFSMSSLKRITKTTSPYLWQTDPVQHITGLLKFFSSIINLSITAFSKDLIGGVFVKMFYPGILDALSFICKHYLLPDIQVTDDKTPIQGLPPRIRNIGIARELTAFLQNVVTRLNEKGDEGLMNELVRTPICSQPEQHKPLIDFLVMQLKGDIGEMTSSVSLGESDDLYMGVLNQCHVSSHSRVFGARVDNNESIADVCTTKGSNNSRGKSHERNMYKREPSKETCCSSSSSPVENVYKVKFNGMGTNNLLLFHVLGMHDDEGQTCDRFVDATINGERESFHRFFIINCLVPATRIPYGNDTGTSQDALAYYGNISSSMSESFIHCLKYLLELASLDNKELLLSRVILHPDSVVLPWVRAAAEVELMMYSSSSSSTNYGNLRTEEVASNLPASEYQQDVLKTIFAPVSYSILCGNLRFLRTILNIVAPWYSPSGNTSHLSDLFITLPNSTSMSPNDDVKNDSLENGKLNQRVISLGNFSSSEEGIKELCNKGFSKPIELAILWKDLILRSLILLSAPVFTIFPVSSVNVPVPFSQSTGQVATRQRSFRGRLPFVDNKYRDSYEGSFFSDIGLVSATENYPNNRNSSIFTPYLLLYALKGGSRKTSAFHCTLRSILCLLESDVDYALLPEDGCHSLQRIPGGVARLLPSYRGEEGCQNGPSITDDTLYSERSTEEYKQIDGADNDVRGDINKSFCTYLQCMNDEDAAKGTPQDISMNLDNNPSTESVDPAIFLEKLMFSVLSRISVLSSYRRAMLAIYSGASVRTESFRDSINMEVCCESKRSGSLSAITATIPEPFKTVWLTIEDNTIRQRVDKEISDAEMTGMQELHQQSCSGVNISQLSEKKLDLSSIDEDMSLKHVKSTLSPGSEDLLSSGPIPERLLLIATIRSRRDEIRQRRQSLTTHQGTKKGESKDTRDMEITISPTRSDCVTSPPRDTGRFACDSPFRPHRGSFSLPSASSSPDNTTPDWKAAYSSGSHKPPLMAQAGVVDELPADLPALHHGHSHDNTHTTSASLQYAANEAARAALSRCSPYSSGSQRRESPTWVQGRLSNVPQSNISVIMGTTTPNNTKTDDAHTQGEVNSPDYLSNTACFTTPFSSSRTPQEGDDNKENHERHISRCSRANSHEREGEHSPIPASPYRRGDIPINDDTRHAPSTAGLSSSHTDGNVTPSPTSITVNGTKPPTTSSSAIPFNEKKVVLSFNPDTNKTNKATTVRQPSMVNDRTVPSQPVLDINKKVVGVRRYGTVSPRPPGSPSQGFQARTLRASNSLDMISEAMSGKSVNGRLIIEGSSNGERATSAPADVCKKPAPNYKDFDENYRQPHFTRSRFRNNTEQDQIPQTPPMQLENVLIGKKIASPIDHSASPANSQCQRDYVSPKRPKSDDVKDSGNNSNNRINSITPPISPNLKPLKRVPPRWSKD